MIYLLWHQLQMIGVLFEDLLRHQIAVFVAALEERMLMMLSSKTHQVYG